MSRDLKVGKDGKGHPNVSLYISRSSGSACKWTDVRLWSEKKKSLHINKQTAN